MKRIMAILLTCVLLFAGCTSSPAPSSPAASSPAPSSTPASSPAPESTGSALDKYPEKPVTVVVPWGVGGASDLLFRAIAAQFPKYSGGQPLVVSNVEGGSSVVGVTEYKNMKPDGYTILMWATAQSIKTQMSKTPYESTDFKPIFACVNDSPYILVPADSKFKTLKDLVDYAKANPGKLTMGNSGAGGGNHLAALQFCIAAGIEVNHIPFAGGGASAQATMGKEVDCSVNVPAEGLSAVEAGKLRILAVLGEKRMAGYPDVPTAKEQGFDVVNMQTRGAVIHKDAPAGVAEKLEQIFKNIAADPEFEKALKDLSMNLVFATGKEYEEMIKNETELYMNIIKENKLGERYK